MCNRIRFYNQASSSKIENIGRSLSKNPSSIPEPDQVSEFEFLSCIEGLIWQRRSCIRHSKRFLRGRIIYQAQTLVHVSVFCAVAVRRSWSSLQCWAAKKAMIDGRWSSTDDSRVVPPPTCSNSSLLPPRLPKQTTEAQTKDENSASQSSLKMLILNIAQQFVAYDDRGWGRGGRSFP